MEIHFQLSGSFPYFLSPPATLYDTNLFGNPSSKELIHHISFNAESRIRVSESMVYVNSLISTSFSYKQENIEEITLLVKEFWLDGKVELGKADSEHMKSSNSIKGFFFI